MLTTKSLIIVPVLRTIAFLVLSASAFAQSPIVRSFNGDTGPASACTAPHCDRPEMNVAANGSQVVEVTWQNVNVYDYSGNLLRSTPMTSFITNAGLNPSTPIEPHVIYDEFIQRWVITVSCSLDCVLVSASSDATGAWSGAYLDNNGADPAIHLGYDKNGVYFTEYQLGSNPDATLNGYADVYFAIPNSEMQWTGSFNPVHKNRAANMPFDGMATVDQTPTKSTSAPAFFIAKSCINTCQNVTNLSFQWVLNTLTWSGTTATYGSDQLVNTNWLYNTPIAGVPQAGTGVQLRFTESHRPTNAVGNGNHLYTIMSSGPCTSSCGSQGSDANNLFFWVDLDCTNSAACVVNQTGKVSDPNNSFGWPTIGATSGNDLSIVALGSGSGINLSIFAWTRKATDPPNTLTGPITIVSGTQPYTCSANPLNMSNSVGINTSRDPADATKLWTVHQYSNSASACSWATRIVEIAPGGQVSSGGVQPPTNLQINVQ